MCTETDAGTPTWVCARNFEACNTTAECTLGLALPTANCSDAGADPDFCIETCSGEQDVCVDEFRHPQNSRFGKSAVWGFEEVHVRGCASTCEALNQSADTGIGVTCCTDDLCNTSSRASVAPVLLVALCIMHAIALAFSTP
ncbi:Hypothetical Protein FCC1311_099862 [Hondaea fermentalgiana]|uniref:Snake toxin/toxin-like domain-containing protein n=1 Tax=Hondaea fermentalgiana TaxID=2315210 RepID=A0A2R5GYG0_9STRA|nr:Hypothetical Protein FCC1311_099862 [Hondaea fermentalgiana]|eukprot:GBG33763.1 Hypothetical Protein FCC1311_099862 [Hondaea fermentalgiana]